MLATPSEAVGFEAAGLHFESLVARDLRVYSQPLGATLASWRDSRTGAEVGIVLELPDGRWAGIEVELGSTPKMKPLRRCCAWLSRSTMIDMANPQR